MPQPVSPTALKGPSVAVVGAGVGGLVTATALLDAGCAVTLYERDREVGPGCCSWMSGGMLAPWCEKADTDPEVVARGVMALDWWEGHVDAFERHGSLVLSSKRDRSEIATYASRTTAHESLDGAAITALEPDLARLYQDGLFYPREGHLDPREALLELAQRFEARGGTLHTGRDVRPEGLGEDVVVDCRGLGARDCLPRLRGVRGEMLRVRTDDVTLTRPVRLLHLREPIYIVPRAKGEFMIGASSVETDWDGPVSVRTAARYLEACERLHPAFGQAEVIELGAGVRPAYPDNLPEVTREGRVIYLNGLYRHGWLLSPWCAGQVMAQMENMGVLHG
ncbi:FAD-dependent oxidoreductase [Formicincola oecophyllae]|uniref:D-amino-acid oxidase n=1 Tax=Formicincola oecophyllae TaxID=2558361 RepID=A0A4Y6UC43_9PROT|nr:FAD-dependent oxidoreductase [Formicincola oecophyllae]QDH13685.1 FAD-dependent oxidoreductase [Formicincola oecophyllae]